MLNQNTNRFKSDEEASDRARPVNAAHRCGQLTCALILAALAVSTPAAGQIWPGSQAPPGGAIAAKVVGEVCPGVMSEEDVAELKNYIAERARHFQSGRRYERRFAAFFPQIEERFRASYAQPGGCTREAADMARDILERVRRTAPGTGFAAPQK